MQGDSSNPRDSLSVEGGVIPGSAGQPAFTLTCSEASPIPILIAVPHAGRAYPANLVDLMRHPGEATLKLEDRYVDLLGKAVARATGAALLVAHAPRAMVDLNRGVEEMDWDMLRLGPPAGRLMTRIGRRARGGLGLVPRRLPGMGEIWKQRIEVADLESRIEGVHKPYHQSLAQCLEQLRSRWGAALLIDLHSMPPLAPREVGELPSRFVIGDRFGTSCDGILCAAAFDEFSRGRLSAAHNRPYAGGYVLDRHAAPEAGLHAMQLEICRSTYLDSRFAEPGSKIDQVVDMLNSLIRRLASEVAMLGRGGQLQQAAE